MPSGFYNYKILHADIMKNGIDDFNQYIMDIMMPQVMVAKDIIEGDEDIA